MPHGHKPTSVETWFNRKTLAWAFYDFADTAFSALFITFFFPILIKVYFGGNEFQIGLAMGLSVAVAAFLVPIIGAFSDITLRRMPILVAAALATAVFVIAVGYAGLLAALILGFFARITNLISKDVYDAKMTDLVPTSQYGSLSGFGVAVGYLGTIVSLLLGYFLLSQFGWETIEGIRAIFFEVAFFYIIFSLPFFILVKDTALKTPQNIFIVLKKSVSSVVRTVKNLPRFPVFSRFLAASFLYNNGMNAVVIFLVLYGREVIGIGTKEFFPIFGVFAVAAGIGAFAAGKISDRKGPAKLIRLSLLVWVAITIILIAFPSYESFLIAGIAGGGALGAIWTLNRHMVGVVAPEGKVAELFGLEGLTEKFSGLLGPVVFGYLVISSGYTLALSSMLIFFIAGLFLMRKIQ